MVVFHGDHGEWGEGWVVVAGVVVVAGAVVVVAVHGARSGLARPHLKQLARVPKQLIPQCVHSQSPHLGVYMYAHVYMRICVYACVYVYLCVCMCVCVSIM